jgi:hypothetical protein
VETVALVALAVAMLLVLGLLARTIASRYRCASAHVGGAAADGCGAAAASHGDAPAAPDTTLEPQVATEPGRGRAAAAVAAVIGGAREVLQPAIAAERERLLDGMMRQMVYATDEDIAVVRAQVRRLPFPVLADLHAAGVSVMVTHGKVTEVLPHLKGVKIGSGKVTYDEGVSGAYEPTDKMLVIPAKEARNDPRLTAHEAGHALDWVRGLERNSEDFTAARDKDLALLDEYHKQRGERGLRETYADSFAAYTARDRSWPHLYAFWECALEKLCSASGKPLEPPPP